MDVRRVTVRPRESIVHERSSVRLVPIHPTRLFRLPHVLKIPQVVLSLLILFMTRFATGPDILHREKIQVHSSASYRDYPEMVDREIFMTTVYFGTFAFQLMLIVGIIAGDVAPTVNGLFSTYGAVFFLIAGIIGIVEYGRELHEWQVHIVIGTLALVNSLLFLAETIVSLLPQFSAAHQ